MTSTTTTTFIIITFSFWPKVRQKQRKKVINSTFSQKSLTTQTWDACELHTLDSLSVKGSVTAKICTRPRLRCSHSYSYYMYYTYSFDYTIWWNLWPKTINRKHFIQFFRYCCCSGCLFRFKESFICVYFVFLLDCIIDNFLSQMENLVD